MKRILKIMLILTILGCICYLLYVHRRVIKAIISGEKLPEAPAGHCHCFCHGRCCKKGE